MHRNMPVDLVLVRHGQSEGNLAQKLARQGEIDLWTSEFRERHNSLYRLTDVGRMQARIAGEYIRRNISPIFDKYFTSEYVRAMETAAALELPHARWATEVYLRERDRGVLANKPHSERLKEHQDEFVRKARDAFYWQPSGGESIANLCLRVDRVLESLGENCSGLRVIVVCHGGVIKSFRALIERVRSSEYQTTDKIHNCQIVWYTRRDPRSGYISSKYNWVKSICPWSPQLSKETNQWREIKRHVYSNVELIRSVRQVQQLVNLPLTEKRSQAMWETAAAACDNSDNSDCDSPSSSLAAGGTPRAHRRRDEASASPELGPQPIFDAVSTGRRGFSHEMKSIESVLTTASTSAVTTVAEVAALSKPLPTLWPSQNDVCDDSEASCGGPDDFILSRPSGPGSALLNVKDAYSSDTTGAESREIPRPQQKQPVREAGGRYGQDPSPSDQRNSSSSLMSQGGPAAATGPATTGGSVAAAGAADNGLNGSGHVGRFTGASSSSLTSAAETSQPASTSSSSVPPVPPMYPWPWGAPLIPQPMEMAHPFNYMPPGAAAAATLYDSRLYPYPWSSCYRTMYGGGVPQSYWPQPPTFQPQLEAVQPAVPPASTKMTEDFELPAPVGYFSYNASRPAANVIDESGSAGVPINIPPLPVPYSCGPLPPTSQLPAPQLPASQLPASQLPASQLPTSQLPAPRPQQQQQSQPRSRPPPQPTASSVQSATILTTRQDKIAGKGVHPDSKEFDAIPASKSSGATVQSCAAVICHPLPEGASAAVVPTVPPSKPARQSLGKSAGQTVAMAAEQATTSGEPKNRPRTTASVESCVTRENSWPAVDTGGKQQLGSSGGKVSLGTLVQGFALNSAESRNANVVSSSHPDLLPAASRLSEPLVVAGNDASSSAVQPLSAAASSGTPCASTAVRNLAPEAAAPPSNGVARRALEGGEFADDEGGGGDEEEDEVSAMRPQYSTGTTNPKGVVANGRGLSNSGISTGRTTDSISIEEERDSPQSSFASMSDDNTSSDGPSQIRKQQRVVNSSSMRRKKTSRSSRKSGSAVGL